MNIVELLPGPWFSNPFYPFLIAPILSLLDSTWQTMGVGTDWVQYTEWVLWIGSFGCSSLQSPAPRHHLSLLPWLWPLPCTPTHPHWWFPAAFISSPVSLGGYEGQTLSHPLPLLCPQCHLWLPWVGPWGDSWWVGQAHHCFCLCVLGLDLKSCFGTRHSISFNSFCINAMFKFCLDLLGCVFFYFSNF